MNTDRDEIQEAIDRLYAVLSEFEKMALTQYLANKSYEEIHKFMCKKLRRKIRIQSITNALMRIRYRAKKVEIDEDIWKRM